MSLFLAFRLSFRANLLNKEIIFILKTKIKLYGSGVSSRSILIRGIIMSFNEAKHLVRSKCFVQSRIRFAVVASKAVAPMNVVDLEAYKSSTSAIGTKPFSFNFTSSTKSGNPTCQGPLREPQPYFHKGQHNCHFNRRLHCICFLHIGGGRCLEDSA